MLNLTWPRKVQIKLSFKAGLIKLSSSSSLVREPKIDFNEIIKAFKSVSIKVNNSPYTYIAPSKPKPTKTPTLLKWMELFGVKFSKWTESRPNIYLKDTLGPTIYLQYMHQLLTKCLFTYSYLFCAMFYRVFLVMHI